MHELIPFARQGWTKLTFNTRQMAVLYLIGWAIKVAPKGEVRLILALLVANKAVLTFEEKAFAKEDTKNV